MANRYTPGPWKNDCFLVTAANGREVAHTGLLGRRRGSYADQGGEEEDEANARLIAAAPDLLDALEESLALNINWSVEAEPEALAYYSEYKQVIAQARAAIARVKGLANG